VIFYRPSSKRPCANRLPVLALTVLFCGHLSGAESSKTNSAALERHWSFVPPVAVAPPSLPDGKRPENPIDAFVLAKLRELHIQQAGLASKAELLRRVT